MSVNLAIFNIGPIELLIMAAAAVMLFGGDLPATARKAARTVGRLRALAAELGREFSAEEHLPKRSDLGIDLKQLAKLDEGPIDTRPDHPGRREDEPIPDPTEADAPVAAEDVALPAWRKSLASEVPEDDDREDASEQEPGSPTDDRPTG
jgi:Sec-independent protein translocase protein TatA